MVEGSLSFMRLGDIIKFFEKHLREWEWVGCPDCGKRYLKHRYYIEQERLARESQRQEKILLGFDCGL